MNEINPGHSNTRDVLRIVGPVLVVVGLVFIVIGIGSFFAAFGGFGPPRYFWCAFVGMPILFVGLVMSKFGYLGRVSRYVAGETAPVAKDTFNYMAEGTQQGVQTLATAVGEGLRGSGARLRCPKCGQSNDADAKFCRNCGTGLGTACPSCGHLNEAEASFCDTCGKAISAA
jgi:membrane protease subunit (stomatin/prohibitin family)